MFNSIFQLEISVINTCSLRKLLFYYYVVFFCHDLYNNAVRTIVRAPRRKKKLYLGLNDLMDANLFVLIEWFRLVYVNFKVSF